MEGYGAKCIFVTSMKNMARQIISCFLLATFLFAAAPQHLIHVLCGHEDTVDKLHTDLQIGQVHTHCCSLQLSLPLFIGPAEAVLPETPIELTVVLSRVLTRCLFSFPVCSSDRGPPVVC